MEEEIPAENENTTELLPLRSIISTTLSSLKLSVERFPSSRNLRDPIFQIAWRDAVLKIESIRIHISPVYHAGRKFDDRMFRESLENVRVELEALLHDENFLLVTKGWPFRLHHPAGSSRPGNILEATLRNKKPSIRDAIREIIIFINSVQEPQKSANPTLRELRKIVPDQKVSPVQFT